LFFNSTALLWDKSCLPIYLCNLLVLLCHVCCLSLQLLPDKGIQYSAPSAPSSTFHLPLYLISIFFSRAVGAGVGGRPEVGPGPLYVVHQRLVDLAMEKNENENEMEKENKT
jgi:hypothetical protein